MEKNEDKDPLTGLPRAGAFQRQLEIFTISGVPGGVPIDSVTAVLVKIRDFSEVYSQRGKAVGDALLVAVAERLVGEDRAQCVAKVGGDQFALFRLRPEGESNGQWARGLRMLLSDPYELNSEIIKLRFHVTFVNGPKADGRDLLWLVMRVAQGENEREYVHELEASRQLVQGTQAVLMENVALKENYAVMAHNTDSMKQDMEVLRREAHTDYLTALLNRRGLDRTLSNGQQLTAIAFVDLDDLKAFNELDELWNDGDEAIVGVAKKLRDSLDTALVTRWGGDEFLIAEMEDSADALCSRLTDLVEACRRDVVVSGRPVTFSAGVTSFGSDFKSSCAVAQRMVKKAKLSRATVICGDL